MPTWAQRSTEVIQASGMIAVQVGCTPDEAVELMAHRAMLEGKSREDIADAVFAGQIRFDS